MVEDNLITARVLAKELNLSIDTIWRYTREKRIPFIDLGNKQYRYKLETVIAALSSPCAVREEAAEYSLKNDRLYTYQDYLNMPDEPGFRLEILDGILVKEPSPSVMHQRVLRVLALKLEDYFGKHDPEGEVFFAPLDVTFRDVSVVQPDLIYIAGTQYEIIEENRVNGAPTLAIEIISPSSRRKDRLQKLQLYQKEGVEHYWVVSPEDKSLECYHLNGEVYSLVVAGMDEETVEHPAFVGLAISLGTLWERNSRSV